MAKARSKKAGSKADGFINVPVSKETRAGLHSLKESMQVAGQAEVIEKLVGLTVVGRAGHPDDVARAAMFFLSPANSYVTGQVLHVCGGSSLGGAPW